MNCSKKAIYSLGSKPSQEKIGPQAYSPVFIEYFNKVDIGETEFVYGFCGDEGQAILINKRNPQVYDRARNLSSEISQEIGEKAFKPMNIVLIWIDSVSRQHFYRNFPKTIKYLNNELVKDKKFVGYDFIINNANAASTVGNMIPLFFGENLSTFDKKISGLYWKNQNHLDRYKQVQENAIWKYYQDLGFVTAFGYETTWDFVTDKLGPKIHTDHNMFNYINAGCKLFKYVDNKEEQRCMGLKDVHRHMFDYSMQFLENYDKLNKFVYMHLSAGHEATRTVVRTIDPDLEDLIKRTLKKFENKEEDVVIMIGSDHGSYNIEWDQSIENYLEIQLPFQFLITNKELIRRIGPKTDEVLKWNTNRITGRYDWYLTLKHLGILPYGNINKSSDIYLNWKQDKMDAHSVFLEKSDNTRSCSDIDIDRVYCSCIQWVNMSISDISNSVPVSILAEQGIHSINRYIELKNISNNCRFVELDQIISAMDHHAENSLKRRYKIRIKIKNYDVYFDLFGFMADSDIEFKKFAMNELQGLRPVQEFMFKEKNVNKKMKIQLREIERFHEDHTDDHKNDFCVM